MAEKRDIIKETFHTKNSFSIMITKIANETNQSCMDALIEYCSDHDIDVEEATPYISQALKDQIEKEAFDLNMLKTNKGKLPF